MLFDSAVANVYFANCLSLEALTVRPISPIHSAKVFLCFRSAQRSHALVPYSFLLWMLRAHVVISILIYCRLHDVRTTVSIAFHVLTVLVFLLSNRFLQPATTLTQAPCSTPTVSAYSFLLSTILTRSLRALFPGHWWIIFPHRLSILSLLYSLSFATLSTLLLKSSLNWPCKKCVSVADIST